MSFKSFSKFFYRSLSRRLARPLPLQRWGSVRLQSYPPLDRFSGKTLVLDVEGGLLRSSSIFPYFMLVAMEAGGFLRGLILLLLYPLLCCLRHDAAISVMVMVCFCGLRERGFRVGRAVLPKFFLEDVGMEGFEILRQGAKRVCVSSMPRVMVEGFLKDYLDVEVVMARELKVFAGHYTGLMVEEKVENRLSLKEMMLGGEDEVGEHVVGFGSYPTSLKQHCFSQCKEVYILSETEKRNWRALPTAKYPKPLVFHDGRLAFRPTPAATLVMFIWLPIAIPLAVFRVLVSILLPYHISVPIGSLTGMKTRIMDSPSSSTQHHGGRGRLYVCNHRTLLDPIYVSAALNKPVTAVTYSVSRVSELLSPIRTARLTRNKEQDRRGMEALLSQGDLVVCPEGTTCREPFLLRFSPLFTELTDEVVPVALVTRVGMFYGTTASGFKCFDPFFFLMNPRPEYEVQFSDAIPTPSTVERSSIEMANHVQSEIGRALGFECTTLTRKDKYMVLAGNEGAVDGRSKKQ